MVVREVAARRTLVFSLLLLFLASILYVNTLENNFVLDDTAYIQSNHLLKDLKNIPLFFDVPENALIEDLPSGFLRGRNLRWVTYAFDYAMGGGKPFWFHLSNLLWHALAVLSFFFLLRRWFDEVTSFLSAALFAAHPIQTAAVSYISGRKDILAALFVFLALICIEIFRKQYSYSWLLLSGFVFFLAYYSKEVAIVLPVLLVLKDVSLEPSIPIFRLFRAFWREYLFLGVLALVFALRTLGEAALAADPVSAPVAQGNLGFLNLLCFYGLKLLYPIGLLADYRDVFSFSVFPSALQGWPSFLAAGFLFLPLLVFRSRFRLLLLGLGWIVVCLLPVSHLIPFHYPVAEHYLYLPCAGFSLLLGAGFVRWRVVSGPKVWVILGALLLAGSWLTIERNRDWRNMETITLDILAKAPQHQGALNTLAHLYAEKGEDEKALEAAKAAVSRDPFSATNHFNLGILFEKEELYQEARNSLVRAMELDPRYWDAYIALSDLELRKGSVEKGLEVLDSLTRLYGYHPLAAILRGNSAARNGRWQEALGHYRQARQLAPLEAYSDFSVAFALWNLGEKAAARPLLESARRKGLDPEWAGGQDVWEIFLRDPEVSQILKN